jgi:LmbE family N-acetylglucosaminyl deacetylase
MPLHDLPIHPERVLAIGAHPDDVEFFAGGTVARLASLASQITLVVCTDGGRGGRGLADAAGVRRGEQQQAQRALGIGELVMLGHPDAELEPTRELRSQLLREVRRVRPELVLVHDPRTLWTEFGGRAHPGHSDHRAAGAALLDAVYPRAASPNFEPDAGKPWYPREIWLFDTTAPSLLLDVGEVFAAKQRALEAHASQESAAGGLVEAARELAKGFGGGSELAEGFARLKLW